MREKEQIRPSERGLPAAAYRFTLRFTRFAFFAFFAFAIYPPFQKELKIESRVTRAAQCGKRIIRIFW